MTIIKTTSKYLKLRLHCHRWSRISLLIYGLRTFSFFKPRRRFVNPAGAARLVKDTLEVRGRVPLFLNFPSNLLKSNKYDSCDDTLPPRSQETGHLPLNEAIEATPSSSTILFCDNNKSIHNGSPDFRECVPHWDCESSQPKTQDRSQERCSFHYHGCWRIRTWKNYLHASVPCESHSAGNSANPYTEIPSSPLPSRTTPTIRRDTQSKSTRPSRSRSQRLSLRRSSSKVYHIGRQLKQPGPNNS